MLKPGNNHLELRERENGIYVPNLHSVLCKNVDDMLSVMNSGNKNRTTGFTNMNEHSSRSHAVFLIKIEMCEMDSTAIKVGCLNLVDLAGSERQSKTGATAERLKEASKINRALSSLGNVISALAEKSPHVPYRDSKLTRLLQDSLGGNSKTIMIANIGPSEYNYNETLTTLRYAHRAKTIQNKPVMNEDPQDTQLREYQEEIARLKQLITDRQSKEKPAPRRKKSARIRKTSESEKSESEAEEEPLDDTINEKQIQAITAEANEAIEREKEVTTELAKKLQELEGQLIRGGKNILDTYTERQIELDTKMAEIAERKKREIEMQQQLELQEESTIEIRETFTSLQQEVELKTRKLKKCYAKCMALKQEIQDTKEEHNRDQRELEMTQNELIKELKRLLLITDNFVPLEVKQRLYTQAHYDDELEEWSLNPNLLNENQFKDRPVAHSQNRRPMSEYAMNMIKVNNGNVTRFKNENIVSHELDMPLRTTYEYKNPKVSASLQAVLAEAMKTEDDIDITEQVCFPTFSLSQYFSTLLSLSVLRESNESTFRSHNKPPTRTASHSQRSDACPYGIRSATESSRHKESPIGCQALPKNSRIDSEIRRAPHLSFVFINVRSSFSHTTRRSLPSPHTHYATLKILSHSHSSPQKCFTECSQSRAI